MRAAAVVLAGGRSTRMGADKASLEWHGSTLLRHVVGLAARGSQGPVVVVRAPGQPLPDLPGDVEVYDDPREGRGPLQGIATGLAAVEERAEVSFVCATDLPFLHPAFVRRCLRAFELADATDHRADVVLPTAGGHAQPLAAAYRTSLSRLAAKLVQADRLRPAFLFDECETLRLDDAALLADAQLAAADPGLDSVVNVNDTEGYAAARSRPAPEVNVLCFGVVASRVRRGGQLVRAATVGVAAERSGVTWDRHVLAAVNGEQTSRDPQLPLVTGDTVAFLSADAGG